MNNAIFTIITFYQFKKNKDIVNFKEDIKKFCTFNKIRGTVIIAEEGINGSLASIQDSIDKFIFLLNSKGFNNLELKYSYNKSIPFNRLKIKIKKEIVTFKSPIIKNKKIKGKYIEPKNWNAFVKNENTLLIDVRNNFEVQMGTFTKSLNPKTKNFTEFKKFVNENLKLFKKNKIALFCTGGIRCEKAAFYMAEKGFKDVNQLRGGILKYLEKIPKRYSIWQGECFVFDNRVSVNYELKKGTYDLCHACRNPINLNEKKSKYYIKGISCSRCYNKITIKKKKSLIERNKQIAISKRKGLYNPYIKFSAYDLY